MTPFVKTPKEQETPLFSATFLIWVYYFYTDRIEICRNFFLTRKISIYIDKIEMLMAIRDPISSWVKRCNLILTSAGNLFFLWGLPRKVMEQFAEQYAQAEDANSATVQISTRSLLKKSVLQTKWAWYFLINLVIWPIILTVGKDYIQADSAPTVFEYALKHMPVVAALVVALGIPTAFIWIWVFTGGYLMEFLKYYRYTATRRGDLLYFEHGFLIRRQVYLDTTRITIVEFKQSPFMQLFGYGQLSIRASGHNPLFFKSKLLIPFIHHSKLPGAMAMLFPSVEQMELKKQPRALCYNFITWKWLIPMVFVVFANTFSGDWWILFGICIIGVIVSVTLEYRHAGLWILPDAPPHPILIISRGGFHRTTAWIDARRIEMISVSGSRSKIRKGFLNIRIRVFDKTGTYALIRNIDESVVDGFKGLDEIL